MRKSNIAILTTVANFELYGITSKLFPPDIKKYVIDGRNGMHGMHSINYMFHKLSNKNIDWLILADEDVVFKNAEAVYSIISKMKAENLSVCGVRDGGIISHRNYNPIAINTFFSIINFKEILKIWNKEEVKKHQYILPSEFEFDKTQLNGLFDIHSLYEPYYCFFFWLKRKGKRFLYIDSQMLDDNISNALVFEGEVFAYHTWHARSYKVNEKHTVRINKVLKEMQIEFNSSALDSNVVIFKDRFFFIKMKIKKTYKKILNKLKMLLNKIMLLWRA